LIAKGFELREPDGIFGTKTEEAVKKFQQSHSSALQVTAR
jgi:peptidoglycan hydrolase-like protein with peptidoglycan-binding domain